MTVTDQLPRPTCNYCAEDQCHLCRPDINACACADRDHRRNDEAAA